MSHTKDYAGQIRFHCELISPEEAQGTMPVPLAAAARENVPRVPAIAGSKVRAAIVPTP